MHYPPKPRSTPLPKSKHSTTTSPSIKPLHHKGLLIITLLLLADSLTLCVNAVSFFSNSRPSSPSSNIVRGDCSSSSESSSSSSSSSNGHTCQSQTNSPRLSRNRRDRRGTGGRTKCTKPIQDCCQQHCPSCFITLRGGSMEATAATGDLLSAAASTASETLRGTASTTTTPFGLPLNVWKIFFQFLLTTLNVVCWLVPLRAKRFAENELGLSIANAFSGGVFLSLAFGHLIPECVHGFDGLSNGSGSSGQHNASIPYMLVLFGYLLIFFVEKVAFDAHGLMEGGGSSGSGVGGGGEVGGEGEEGGLNTGRSAVILLGALAVHSILEMTALGLADTFGDTALLSASIALHQPAESIALLVAFLKSGMPKDRILKYLSVFSTMGPIGVGIGMVVNEFASPLVDSIMLAIVAGTFIYVGATEVIPEEWEEREHKYKKFFALMAGIVTIYGITQYAMNLEPGS